MNRFFPILTLLGLCWTVFLANALLFQGALNHWGITPRELPGLPGIAFAPFLHASLGHILANTLPLLVLGIFISTLGRQIFITTTVLGILGSGAIIWLLGRHGDHIGASSLIFCYFGFLLAKAYFDRTFSSFLMALATLFLYGGIVWGILPTAGPISWEGHGAGLLTGILIAKTTVRKTRTA